MLEPLDSDLPDDFDEDLNPDRLQVCDYWRCGELFEMKTSNHQFCRKACRSRQRKWERSQVRKAARAAKKAGGR
ncbi:MAG: hypothetical protein R8J94_07220 [Acidimicrobiia bacterium]|nr:hypothetical protein [Acidimicrobiia bacterium]